MGKLMVALIRGAVFAGLIGCTAEIESYAGHEDGSDDVVASAEALSDPCRRWPRRPGCRQRECGDGVVDTGEACDDGNQNDGDGCSAQCELDDDSTTPGDERPGYVWCGRPAPDLTCGPDQGCCAQPNPDGPACAAERSECGPNPTFQECDGAEDCPEDLRCFGTRFGNACASTGYYWLCHTDADCEPSRPDCNENGICSAVPATP